jgi:Uma2 family endonuclease
LLENTGKEKGGRVAVETSTVAGQKRKTIKDFALLPEGAPYQLIDGEFVMSPSPLYDHQRIVFALAWELGAIVKGKRIGNVVTAPIDVYLSDVEVFQPDIMYISNERASIIKEKIHGAPDLVMEVLSPATAYYDLVHKKSVYEATGVREYWIVDPKEKSIEIFLNGPDGFQSVAKAAGQGTVHSSIIDGFVITLGEVFEGL